MTRDFDNLITEAAPMVPDSGPSRRTARALLHERMRRSARRRRVGKRRRLALAAGLAFVVITGSQVSRLGSDGFEVEMSTLDIGNGSTVPVARNKNRGIVATPLPGMNADDVFELEQQSLLQEGTVEFIEAFSFNRGTPHWTINYLMYINGREIRLVRDPVDLSVESQRPGRDKIRFLLDHADEFKHLVDTRQIDPRAYGQIYADGLTFRIRQWSREFPGWGLVTYYRGEPLESSR